MKRTWIACCLLLAATDATGECSTDGSCVGNSSDEAGLIQFLPGQSEFLKAPRTTRIHRGVTRGAYHAAKIFDSAGSLGDVTGFSAHGSELNVSCGKALVSLTFISDAGTGWNIMESMHIHQMLVGPDDGEIVTMPKHGDRPSAHFVKSSSGFTFHSGALRVTGSLKPLKLQLHQGMQNGYSYDHTGRLVIIQEPGDDDGWDAGARANPVPFFMSSTGYGCLRNTFMPGNYNFSSPATFSHDEKGLDAFYFVGSMKEILRRYTKLAGKPFLPPTWGLFMGDSDCYNNQRHQYNTSSVLAVAENYTVHNMPRGWMLVNDGYGCGYTTRKMLVETQEEHCASHEDLAQQGLRMGLWTSTGLDQAHWEVSKAHSRVIKTDVAWVWWGYKFGLDAVKLASKIVSLGRRSHASGDVDGIFYGSAETYARDLQWKTFLTVSMYMSGWAPHDKQPWAFGEPYTSYNRKWLQLRARLTPYLYSLSFHAHVTGLPPVRAMELEFPEESQTWTMSTRSSLAYQFMSGPFFLVAPVYENSTTRSDILLPTGEWIDFFDENRRLQGPSIQTMHCPLQEMPVFVRSGAIIPMWPLLNFFGEKRVHVLTLDLYPGASSSFKLYEEPRRGRCRSNMWDDGMTRAYSHGHFATQLFELSSSAGRIKFCIGASKGSYDGKLSARSYWLQVHAVPGETTSSVTFGDEPLHKLEECKEHGSPGWCTSGHTVYVKTPLLKETEAMCVPPPSFTCPHCSKKVQIPKSIWPKDAGVVVKTPSRKGREPPCEEVKGRHAARGTSLSPQPQQQQRKVARVVSSTYRHGNRADFYLDGKKVPLESGKWQLHEYQRRGFNVVTLDPDTQQVTSATCYDTSGGGQVAVAQLATDLNALPEGRVVLVAVRGSGLESLSGAAMRALRRVGATSAISGGRSQEGYVLIGIKGGEATAERRGHHVEEGQLQEGQLQDSRQVTMLLFSLMSMLFLTTLREFQNALHDRDQDQFYAAQLKIVKVVFMIMPDTGEFTDTILEFATTVAQQVLLIAVQSGILISISHDLFYFIVIYSLVLKLS
eukprot:g12245.t1